jgi:hypothetical protein
MVQIFAISAVGESNKVEGTSESAKIDKFPWIHYETKYFQSLEGYS